MSDWIEWKGGMIMPDGDTVVEVRTISGDMGVGVARAFDWPIVVAYRVVSVAGTVRWEPTDRPEDLVAYHVVAPAEEPRTLTGVWVRRDAGGGECPVPHDTLVEVRTISGDVGVDVAGAFDWSVVATYRVVAPSEKPVSRGGVGAVETLRRAADLIEQRGKQRDSDTGERSMARTVGAFNAIYGAHLTETQGWHFMELLKMARSSQGAYVADDFDDKVAYAALAAECEAGARGRTD